MALSQALPRWQDDPKCLPALVETLESAHSRRLRADRQLAVLYTGRGGTRAPSGTRDVATNIREGLEFLDNASAGGFNIIRCLVDAALASFVRMPAVKVLPVGTRYKTQKASKMLSRWVNGVFGELDLGDLAYRAARTAGHSRFGAIKWVINDDGAPQAELVNPNTLFWDDAEGRYPRTLIQEHAVPRHKARALAGKDEDALKAIDEAPRWHEEVPHGWEMVKRDHSDTIKVIEAWSVTVGKDKGRHSVVIAGQTVVDEEWDLPRHIFAVFRWYDEAQVDSFGGQPPAELLLKYQAKLNRYTKKIEKAHAACTPIFWVHESDQFNMKALSGEALERRVYSGTTPPQVTVATAQPAEIYEYKKTLIEEASTELGINLQQAAGTKDAGLTAAVAIREAADLASTRLQNVGRGFSTFVRDNARILIMLAEKDYVSAKTRAAAPGTTMLEEIEFPVGLREEQYSMSVDMTSALPLTAPGRLDFVKELMDSQLIDKADGLQLLQIPDTEKALERKNAARNIAERMIDAALWDGRFIQPLETQDLAYLLAAGWQEYQNAYVSGIDFPPKNMEMLRRLLEIAKSLQDSGAAAQMPAVAAANQNAQLGAPEEQVA